MKSPLQVPYHRVMLLMLGSAILCSHADVQAMKDRLLTDFTPATPDLEWFVLNDNVMGGRSEGGFLVEDHTLQYRGKTNTDGGGFSSIRTSALRLDLSRHRGVRLRVKGDGRRYTWRLATDARYRGRELGYWAEFDTVGGEWQIVDIAFNGFIPRFRGTRLDGPTLDTSRITGMGLMIYDGRDGPFEFELDRVSAYANEAEPFTLESLRWQKRILVLSAPSESDESLMRQRSAWTSALSDSLERDMVLVTLVSHGLSTAGQVVLDGEQVSSIRSVLGMSGRAFALVLVGKDGSAKLSRESVTSMQDIHALIDTMPMRRREISEP